MKKSVCITPAHGRRAISVLQLACAASIVGLFAACAFPQDAGDKRVGVWKMNAQKSNFPGPNAPTSVTMTIEKQGPDSYRETFDIVGKDGQTRHNSGVRTYDGKWRPVEGQAGLMEACEDLDTHKGRCTEKRNGNVVLEILGTFSEDGKTLYAQRTIFDKDGKPISGVVVYEKQNASGS